MMMQVVMGGKQLSASTSSSATATAAVSLAGLFSASYASSAYPLCTVRSSTLSSSSSLLSLSLSAAASHSHALGRRTTPFYCPSSIASSVRPHVLSYRLAIRAASIYSSPHPSTTPAATTATAATTTTPTMTTTATPHKYLPPRKSSTLAYYLRDSPWAKLVKFELSTLAAFSCVFGYYLSGAPIISLLTPTGVTMLAGTMSCAFSAAILNQLKERVYDARMERTRTRPLCTGAISVPQAQTLCASFAIAGAGLLGVASGGALAAPAIGLATIGLYAYVYTPLKRRSIYNTEMGAIVGALPVLVGAACHLPSAAELAAWTPAMQSVWLGFAFMSVWQMPHFMMICHQYARQYANAGFVMRAPDDAPRYGLLWACTLLALPFAGFHLNITSPSFIITGTLCNLYFLRGYYLFYRAPSQNLTRKHIYLYFILMFASICLHAQSNDGLDDVLAALVRLGVPVQALRAYRDVLPSWMQSNQQFWVSLPASLQALCSKKYHDKWREQAQLGHLCVVKQGQAVADRAAVVAANPGAAAVAAGSPDAARSA